MAYDEYLNTTDSAIANPTQRIDSFDFHTQYTQSLIDTGKISVLDFNVLSGGTALLGGVSNGSGVLSVSNTGGTEIVRLDSNGITVNSGSMTIKDSNGTTIVDATGIVGTNNFNFAQALKGNNQNITATSFGNVGSLTLTTGSFSRTTPLLLMTTVTGYHWDPDGLLLGQFAYNGTAVGVTFVIAGQTATAGASQTATSLHIYNAPAGVGTLTLQARQNNVGGTGVIEGSFSQCQLSYLSLGK